MTIKEGEENTLQIIRNISMAKGIMQRRKTCDNFVPITTISNTSSVRRSFRSQGAKPTDITREVKQGDKSRKIVNSPESGRRNISVARVAEAFHELQQKLGTKSRSNDLNDVSSTKNTNSLLKFELSKNHVSRKINMFNKVLRNSNNVNTSSENNNVNKKNKYENNNKNINSKENNTELLTDEIATEIQNNIIISIDNAPSPLGMNPDISEDEMFFIRKRKSIGRSNSAMVPLRELVMTREIAKSRRSLSFSLIPEDDTLSLIDAVERRLNLSKETNLCDTDL